MIIIENIDWWKEVNVLGFINRVSGLTGVFCAGGVAAALAIMVLAWSA
jgi:hypothetical protein